MTRKTFKVGQTLTVSNGNDQTTVTVESVNRTGRRIFVRGNKVCGNLKYYANLGNYTVSQGMTNGKCLDRYELV